MKEKELKNTLENIGHCLTVLRKQKGYTSHESFAYDYKLPRIQYWRIEKGKTNLTVRSLTKILEIHSLTLPEFFILLANDRKNDNGKK